MPRETERSAQQREDEGQQLSRAAQNGREGERDPEREKRLEHDEEQEEIEAELEDLQEMEGPDA